MTKRTILSSNRVVHTIEEENCFYVFHSSHGDNSSVSGPYDKQDSRFSEVIE